MNKNTELFRKIRAMKTGINYDEEKDMVICLVCKEKYILLGSHVVQSHRNKFKTMREYKLFFGLDVKKGRTVGKFKELRRKQNLKYKSFLNLKETGKKYWFVKNDEKAGKYTRSKETLEVLHKLGKRPRTEEYRRKISESKKGKPGYKPNKEQKKHMSELMKKVWERRKKI